MANVNTVSIGYFFKVEEVGNSDFLVGFEGSEG